MAKHLGMQALSLCVTFMMQLNDDMATWMQQARPSPPVNMMRKLKRTVCWCMMYDHDKSWWSENSKDLECMYWFIMIHKDLNLFLHYLYQERLLFLVTCTACMVILKKSSYRMMRMMRMKSRVLRSKTDGFADVFEFEWDKRAIAIDNMEPTVGVSWNLKTWSSKIGSTMFHQSSTLRCPLGQIIPNSG